MSSSSHGRPAHSAPARARSGLARRSRAVDDAAAARRFRQPRSPRLAEGALSPRRRRAAANAELARVLRWTLGIPTVALVSVATLYVLGAIWTWGELQDAGLVPTDVLSLVPHAQILGRGLQLVVLAVLALPLPLAFTWLLHRVVPERGRPWGMPGGRSRGSSTTTGACGATSTSSAATVDPVDEPGRDRRVRRLHTRAKGQRATQRRTALLTRRCDRPRARRRPLRAHARRGWRSRSSACGSSGGRTLGAAPGRLVMFGVLVLAISAERFTAPDPLPEATVRTTQGTLVKGPLVAATEQAWHLKVADQRVKSVPTANIAKSSVHSESRLVRGPLGARLADLLR